MAENKIAKIKKALLIMAVFIPTIAAILVYIIGTVISNNTAKKAIMIEITNSDGIVLDINSSDVKSLISIFEDAEKTKEAVKDFSENLEEMRFITVKLTSLKSEFVYKYYYSENSKKVYTKDDEYNIFILDELFSSNFMSTKYAISLYNYSSPPMLVSSTDDTISPQNIKWMYFDANSQYIKNNLITTVALDSFYLNTNGKFSLSFSLEPDICLVNILDGEAQVFNGTLQEFEASEINFQNPYKYEINAEWLKTDGCKYYGEISYSFTTIINSPPLFWLEKDAIQSGEFVVLSGKYINNIEKIRFECSPSIGFTPTFFVDGQYVRALIPIDMSLSSPAEYSITVTYSNIPTTLNLSVNARTEMLIREYNVESIPIVRNSSVLDQYYNLLSSLTKTTSQVKYFSDTFLDNSSIINVTNNPVMTLLLGFGHSRTTDKGESTYRLDGVDYWTSESGISVRAINAGRVSYVGYCDLLGNFVVIDHGFGLKTWYAHLSTPNISVNETVSKNTVIGTTGKSGFTNSNGFYLITTVYNIPVSPYPLESEGVLMTNR